MATPTENYSANIVRNDGRPHPLENTLAGVAVVLGLLAFFSSFTNDLHLLASWAGLVGILVAAYGQYISATTVERWLFVVGGVASAVGFGIGLAHGGLFGGVIS